MPSQPAPPTIDDIRAAARRLEGFALHTPLVRLNVEDAPAEIYLKLENLQPVGSFKLRPAGNMILGASRQSLAGGVYTASSGNSGLGLAYTARSLGVPARVIVPDSAPDSKLAALERLGAAVTKVPFEDWWKVIVDKDWPGEDGLYFDAVRDPASLAGNGTIGLEIVDDMAEVDTIVAPFGGGGISAGIAAAAKALKPGIRVLGAEIDTAMPLAGSLAAGRAAEVAYRPSFVGAIGVGGLLAEMWPLVDQLIAGAVPVSEDETAAAIRLLYERNRIIAEGAGAVSVAAALKGLAGNGRVVCVVSGGNIDTGDMITILDGGTPRRD